MEQAEMPPKASFESPVNGTDEGEAYLLSKRLVSESIMNNFLGTKKAIL
jgi:hypothetical protein